MDSILERVLSRKEDQEKQSFDAVEVVQELLKQLTSKEADILSRRHGLRQEGRETLEVIGGRYSVTRERIRQIEHQALHQLRTTQSAQDMVSSVEHLVINLLHAHGDVLAEELMYELLLGVHHSSEVYRRSLFFLLTELLKEKVKEIRPSGYFRPGWKSRGTSLDRVESTMKHIIEIMRVSQEPMTLATLMEKIQGAHDTNELYAGQQDALSETILMSYIAISRDMGKNPFDEYGLVSWGSIFPKRMNDRVYLVLKKEGKPLHFEEIAHRVSKIFKKSAYPPTVHNELILNDDYVLVGRGIYALKEWGYTEGVVAEVLLDILRSAGKPMTKNDLVAQVLKQRIVKKNTILLALADRALFQKNAQGLYTVAQATEVANHPA